MGTKKQVAKLDFNKFLLMQKQINVLRSDVIYGEGYEGEDLEDFLNELEFIIMHNLDKEREQEVTNLFKSLNELISEADDSLVYQAKKYLKK